MHKPATIIITRIERRISNELVHIPASHPNVIAVGALDKQGCRGNYSNYSNDMSVVAFWGKTGSLYNFCDIRTTDRMGNKGYVDGNYFDYFGMTSAAAPMVSGVASLMLSVNPNLTSNQVKNIIENTAQKLNGYQFEAVSVYRERDGVVETSYGRDVARNVPTMPSNTKTEA